MYHLLDLSLRCAYSYCIAKNNPDCIYSPRRPQRPRVRKQAPPAPSSPAEPPPPPPTDRVTSAPSAQQQQQQQQQSAPIQSDAIIRPSLKRYVSQFTLFAICSAHNDEHPQGARQRCWSSTIEHTNGKLHMFYGSTSGNYREIIDFWV